MPGFAQRTASLMSEPSRDDPADPNRLARVERTRTEMMAQGAAVAATLQRESGPLRRVARLVAGRPLDHVVIAGCGVYVVVATTIVTPSWRSWRVTAAVGARSGGSRRLAPRVRRARGAKS